MPPFQARKGGEKIANPDWLAIQARVKTRYDIEKVTFTRHDQVSGSTFDGPRNRVIEYLALVSPAVSTRDALAFVWNRAKHTADCAASKKN